MKHFNAFLVATLLAWPTGLVSAKGIDDSPKKPGINRGSPNGTNVKGSNLHKVNMRVRDQKLQIARDQKAGKLTKEQARAAFLKLRDVRKKGLDFTRQNRNKELTVEQKGHLDRMLDDNAGSR
jgi:hypothetical protein